MDNWALIYDMIYAVVPPIEIPLPLFCVSSWCLPALSWLRSARGGASAKSQLTATLLHDKARQPAA